MVALQKRGISKYMLSKTLNIRYELVRRTFAGTRKLTADELLLILEKFDIPFEEVK